MDKRRVLVLIVGATLVHATGMPRAQTANTSIRRVGVFTPGRREIEELLLVPFYEEMRRLGWVEGHNVAYDRVYGGDRMESLPRLAAELVARKPDVIFTGSPPTSSAAKQATSSIPIVFWGVVDPVSAGLVQSLARPGGNATGVTQSVAESLAPKRLELLREILPRVKRIGVLGNLADPGSTSDQMALATATSALGVTMIVASATNPEDFDSAIESRSSG